MITSTELNNLFSEIKGLYLSSDYPWVIGYSGGKDSSCTLQLIWQAISQIKPEDRKTPIFVIYSDTYVETPVISKYLEIITTKIQQAATEKNMPISVNGVFPEINNTFWVNLLGKGYPAPKTKFRWCTDRLKIEPANRFIKKQVSKYGEVIVVLGARKAESASRAQVIEKKQRESGFRPDDLLTKHSVLPNAYVYTPIADFTTEDVWKYLLANPNTPWLTHNRDLFKMYADAQDGECPLVVDKTTPPCGTSRFGCWVCTLVEDDKSLRAMVSKGDVRFKPLLEYRKMLLETTLPENKAKYRSYKRRTGRVDFAGEEDQKIIRGPYKMEYRKEFLKKLLGIQKDINNNENDHVKVIRDDEIKEIRRIWQSEEGDWEDSAAKIYKEVTGKDPNWLSDDSAQFGEKEMDILKKICTEMKVPVELVTRLIDKEREFNRLGRRTNLIKELDGILREEWRSEEEVVKEHKEKRALVHDYK